MKNLRTIFTLAVFSVVFACATTAFGQIKVGGYKPIAVDNTAVEAAATYAVESKGRELNLELSLMSVEKAEVQVVQGMNYRLCLEIVKPPVEEGAEGITTYFQTIVYQNLKRAYKVTSWKEVNCAAAE